MPITTDYPSAGIAVITIRRPEKLNALDPAHIAELTKAFRELSGNDLRAVILTGEGKAFVGGADIRHMAGLTPETARAFITSLHNLFTAIRECPVPVIGAVNGYCLGAGMELAAAGPNAVRAQKRLVRLWEDAPLEEAVTKSVIMFGEAFETDEPATLMASFTK